MVGTALSHEPLPAEPIDHTDQFDSVEAADSTDQQLTPLPFLAEMLTEVFIGMPDLCLRITDDQIGSIFKLIIQCKGDTVGQVALLATLSTIIKVSDHMLGVY